MVQEMVGRVKNLEARLQSCRSLVTPLLNPPPSYSSTIPGSQTDRPLSPNTVGLSSGSPINFANINARRPSEYMKDSDGEQDPEA